MKPIDFLMTALLSFLPISELRGGIPYALYSGMPWWLALLFCVLCNVCVAPFVWIFLATFHKLFSHWKWYAKLFDSIVERTRRKIGPGVEKWGWIGIGIFVAIPFPLTGAWTGTLGAWLLGLSKRKTLAAVIAGVCVAGIIVTAVLVLGVSALDFFVKRSV